MSTPTTTLKKIRDNIESIVESLTPSSLSGVPFRVDRGEEDFAEWAASKPTTAFRRFSLELTDTGELPPVTDNQIEQRDATLTLSIAYPKLWGRYGEENIRDAQDIIEEDYALLIGQSGIGSNNPSACVSGQHLSEVAHDLVDLPGTILSVFEIRVIYNRSVT